MIIPTDGGLEYGDPKWQPMCDWLTVNGFDIKDVPTDALIEIRDETCLGVEVFVRKDNGYIAMDPATDEPQRRVEWHPMVHSPLSILLPEEAK